MDPVIEEERSGALPPVESPATAKRFILKQPFSSSRKRTNMELPSLKYPPITEPNAVVMKQATQPPNPTLPRRQSLCSWTGTRRMELNPLSSGLTGPGRAGKYAVLVGDSGSKFEGEVLAGRPHGYGKYHATKGMLGGTLQYTLQYEGDWVQGRREGQGTRYYLNGEAYTGQFIANIRHGQGRYEFVNGDIYVGQWVDDRRTGKGTYYNANGDIFVGNFIRDKKEGMGTLFMLEKQRKYVAEYCGGTPKCGTMLDLEDPDLEPLRGQLLQLSLHKKLDLAASGRAVSRLPDLQLVQPNKVLGAQVVAVRRARTESKSRVLRTVQAHSGTLSDKDLEMLRHSFTLMAAGDDLKAGLLPPQLRELCVMAGLDPATAATRLLVEALLERVESTGRISFDSFMKVALHFREHVEEEIGMLKIDMAAEYDEVAEALATASQEAAEEAVSTEADAEEWAARVEAQAVAEEEAAEEEEAEQQGAPLATAARSREAAHHPQDGEARSSVRTTIDLAVLAREHAAPVGLNLAGWEGSEDTEAYQKGGMRPDSAQSARQQAEASKAMLAENSAAYTDMVEADESRAPAGGTINLAAFAREHAAAAGLEMGAWNAEDEAIETRDSQRRKGGLRYDAAQAALRDAADVADEAMLAENDQAMSAEADQAIPAKDSRTSAGITAAILTESSVAYTDMVEADEGGARSGTIIDLATFAREHAGSVGLEAVGLEGGPGDTEAAMEASDVHSRTGAERQDSVQSTRQEAEADVEDEATPAAPSAPLTSFAAVDEVLVMTRSTSLPDTPGSPIQERRGRGRRNGGIREDAVLAALQDADEEHESAAYETNTCHGLPLEPSMPAESPAAALSQEGVRISEYSSSAQADSPGVEAQLQEEVEGEAVDTEAQDGQEAEEQVLSDPSERPASAILTSGEEAPEPELAPYEADQAPADKLKPEQEQQAELEAALEELPQAQGQEGVVEGGQTAEGGDSAGGDEPQEEADTTQLQQKGSSLEE